MPSTFFVLSNSVIKAKIWGLKYCKNEKEKKGLSEKRDCNYYYASLRGMTFR